MSPRLAVKETTMKFRTSFLTPSLPAGPEPAEEKLQTPLDLKRGFGNCGVFALAILCNITHDRASYAIQHARRADVKVSRKLGRNGWNGASTIAQRETAIRNLGFKYTTQRCNKSLIALSRDPELYSKKLMCRVQGHAFLLYQGNFYDQGNPNGIPARDSIYAHADVTHITFITAEPETPIKTSFLKK